MKICPKCSQEHTKQGKFCSRSCANSRVFSDEAKKKKSIQSSRWWASLNEEERAKFSSKISATLSLRSSDIADRVHHYAVDLLMTTPFEDLSFERKRKRIFLEQDGKCVRCGINEWLGQPISLELDHKNGDRKDNSRNNLEILCPNCHSQTDTWRGRNNRKLVTDDDIKKKILVMSSIRQIINDLGMPVSKASYRRITRLMNNTSVV